MSTSSRRSNRNVPPPATPWWQTPTAVIAVLSLLVAFASLGVTTWNAWDAHRPGKVEASFEAVGVQGGPAFANVYIIPVTLFNTGAQPTMIRDVVLKASDCVIPAVALQPVAILKPDELAHLGNPHVDYVSQNSFSAFALPGGSSDQKIIMFQTFDGKPLPMPWKDQEVAFLLTLRTDSGPVKVEAQTLFPRHVSTSGVSFVPTTDRLLFNIGVQRNLFSQGVVTAATPKCSI